MFRLQMYEIISTPNNQAVYILIDFLRHFRFQNRRSHKIETPKEKIITPFGQIISAFYFSESPFRCGFVKEYLFFIRRKECRNYCLRRSFFSLRRRCQRCHLFNGEAVREVRLSWSIRSPSEANFSVRASAMLAFSSKPMRSMKELR